MSDIWDGTITGAEQPPPAKDNPYYNGQVADWEENAPVQRPMTESQIQQQQPVEYDVSPYLKDVPIYDDWAAQEAEGTRGYWENPFRVARYYAAMQGAPEGWEPPGIDRKTLENVYNYFEFRNNGKPWYEWAPLPEEESSYLRYLPAPSSDFLAQNEMQFAKEEQIPELLNRGVTDTVEAYKALGIDQVTYQELPWWQKALSTLMIPQPLTDPTPLEGRPEESSFAAALGTGLMSGVGAGVLVGKFNPWAGLIAGVGVTGLTTYASFTGKNVPGLEILEIMDTFEYIAKGVYGGGKQVWMEGFAEVFGSMPEAIAAWRSSQLSYATLPPEIPNFVARLYGMEPAKRGEVWMFHEGFVKPVPLLNTEGQPMTDAERYFGKENLSIIRNEILERSNGGEDWDIIYADYMERFGSSAIIQDLILSTLIDPSWMMPYGHSMVGEGIARATGHQYMAEAYRLSRGSPIGEIPLVGGVLGKITKQGGAGGMLDPYRIYGQMASEGVYTPKGLPPLKATDLNSFGRWVAGTTKEGRIADFENKQGLFKLTPEARGIGFTQKLTEHVSVAVVERDPGKKATDLERVQAFETTVQKYAKVRSVEAGEVGEAIFASPMAATANISIRQWVTKKLDEHIKRFLVASPKIKVLDSYSKALGIDKSKLVEQIQANPEQVHTMLMEKGAIDLVANPEMQTVIGFDKFFAAFTGLGKEGVATKDTLPWSYEMWQAETLNSLIDNTLEYSKNFYGIKEGDVFFKLSQVIKSTQSMLLLDLNPAYLVNNVLNNWVTATYEGVFGFMTPTQVDSWIARFGVVPSRLYDGMGIQGLGDALGQIQDIRNGKGLTMKVLRQVNQVRNKFGIASKISRVAEKHQGAIAYTLGMQRLWGRMHKAGRGFRKMDTALESALTRIDPALPGFIYSTIEAGMNIDEISSSLFASTVTVDVRRMINETAKEIMPDNPDILTNLIEATFLDGELVRIFGEVKDLDSLDGAYKQVRTKLADIRAAKEAADAADRVASAEQNVRGQGFAALMDQYINESIKDGEQIQNSIDRFDRAAEDAEVAEGEGNYDLRKAIWNEANTEVGETWNQRTSQSSLVYKGMLDALSMEEAVTTDFIRQLSSIRQARNDFYSGYWIDANGNRITPSQAHDNYQTSEFILGERDILRRYYVQSRDVSKSERILLWQKAQRDIIALYKVMVDAESAAQVELNNTMARIYTEKTGRDGAEILEWRNRVTAARKKITDAVIDSRERAVTMPKNERRKFINKFQNGKYKKFSAELTKLEIEGAKIIRNRLDPDEPGVDTSVPENELNRIINEIGADQVVNEANQALATADVIKTEKNALDQLQEAFNLTDVERKCVAVVLKLHAQEWAHQVPGRNINDWYRTHLKQVVRDADNKPGGYLQYDELHQGNLYFTKEQIAAANKTSRPWKETKVQKYVSTIAQPDDTILDFGAGRTATTAQTLRDQGFDVTAYDFGDNVVEGVHDRDALTRTYDIVYASNVLNVQSDVKMLRATLMQIKSAAEREVIFNFPTDPRYLKMTPEQVRQEIMGVFGVDPVLVDGTNSNPVWRMIIKEPTELFQYGSWLDMNRVNEGRQLYIKLRNAEFADEWLTRVVEKYGTTDNPRQGGWITPDGKNINLSGREPYRIYTHDVVTSVATDVYPDSATWGYGPRVKRFAMDTGSVRYGLEGQYSDDLYIQIYGPVTRQQIEFLENLIKPESSVNYEISGFSGDMALGSYEAGTNYKVIKAIGNQANQIFNTNNEVQELRSFYQGGKIKAKGSVSFVEDGRAIITAFQGADITTLVHEIGHIFRRDLPAEDLEAIAIWGGLESGAEMSRLQNLFNTDPTWQQYRKLANNKDRTAAETDEMGELAKTQVVKDMLNKYIPAEEKFARGWERWLAEEKLEEIPQGLQLVFKKFSDWIVGIYKQIQGTQIDKNINATITVDGKQVKIRDVYRRLVRRDIDEVANRNTIIQDAHAAGIFNTFQLNALAKEFDVDSPNVIHLINIINKYSERTSRRLDTNMQGRVSGNNLAQQDPEFIREIFETRKMDKAGLLNEDGTLKEKPTIAGTVAELNRQKKTVGETLTQMKKETDTDRPALFQEEKQKLRQAYSIATFVNQLTEMRNLKKMNTNKIRSLAQVLGAFAIHHGMDPDEFVDQHFEGVYPDQDPNEPNGMAVYRRAVEENTTQARIDDYIEQNRDIYGTLDVDDYVAKIDRAIKNLEKHGIRPNDKTILSVDITGNCPFSVLGMACLYCYVVGPMADKEAGIKRLLEPMRKYNFAPYQGQLLEMARTPELRPLLRIMQDNGGLRMFSSGDMMEFAYFEGDSDKKAKGIVEKYIKSNPGNITEVEAGYDFTIPKTILGTQKYLQYSMEFDGKLVQETDRFWLVHIPEKGYEHIVNDPVMGIGSNVKSDWIKAVKKGYRIDLKPIMRQLVADSNSDEMKAALGEPLKIKIITKIRPEIVDGIPQKLSAIDFFREDKNVTFQLSSEMWYQDTVNEYMYQRLSETAKKDLDDKKKTDFTQEVHDRVLKRGEVLHTALKDNLLDLRTLSRSWSKDDLKWVKKNYPDLAERISIRYIAMNIPDLVRVVRDKDQFVDLVTMFHGTVSPYGMTQRWRGSGSYAEIIKNPLLDTFESQYYIGQMFKETKPQGVSLSEIDRPFEEYFDSVETLQNLLDEFESITGKVDAQEVIDWSRKKMCCTTSRCATCPATCGFTKAGNRAAASHLLTVLQDRSHRTDTSLMVDGKYFIELLNEQTNESDLLAAIYPIFEKYIMKNTPSEYWGANQERWIKTQIYLVVSKGNRSIYNLRKEHIVPPDQVDETRHMTIGDDKKTYYDMDAILSLPKVEALYPEWRYKVMGDAINKYFRGEDPPSMVMTSLFSRFKDWLKHIYNVMLMKKYHDFPLAPGVKKMFDDWFGLVGEEEVRYAEFVTNLNKDLFGSKYKDEFIDSAVNDGTIWDTLKSITDPLEQEYILLKIRQTHPDIFKKYYADLKALKDKRSPKKPKKTEAFGPAEPGFQQEPMFQSDLIQETQPDLDNFVTAMRDKYKQELTNPTLKTNPSSLSLEQRKEIQRYLQQVRNDMSGEKLQAMRYGESNRDLAMLNYSKRYPIDNALDLLFPYQFWYTRSMMNWAIRMIDKPGWFALYARIRRMQRLQEMKGVPTRLKGKMRVYAPYLPEWAAGAVYTDPFRYLFPFDAMMQPFNNIEISKSSEEQKIKSILREQLKEEQITQDEYDQALETKEGFVWQSAYKTASEQNETVTPFDMVSMMMSPNMYVKTARELIRGTPEKLTVMPLTRTGQAVEQITKGTSLEVLGNVIGGAMALPERFIRKRAGLSEYGEWGDYYIDRHLANMAADGTAQPAEVLQAMMERQGPIYDEAVNRTQLEVTLKVPGVLLAEAFKGDAAPGQLATAVIFGVFPAGLLPEGELRIRGLYDEYSAAWDEFKTGNKDALEDFYDAYPEYEVRTALYEEPENRLKQFLVGEIWDGYMGQTVDNKKRIRQQFGDQFDTAFLNKETEDIDSIPLDTLARWAKMLNQNVRLPNVPEMQGALAAKDMLPLPAKTDQDLIQTYYDQRSTLFPNVMNVQNLYYDMGKSQEVIDKFPELKKYWDWKRKYESDHPELKWWFEEQRNNNLYGDERSPIENSQQLLTPDQVKEMEPVLIAQLMRYYTTDEPLTDGAMTELYRLWENQGRPGGTFDYYIKTVIRDTFAP